MRRGSTLLLLLLTGQLRLATAPRLAPLPPRGIIFILSDDLGFGDVSIAQPPIQRAPQPPPPPHRAIPTPHVQRIADAGLKFVRAYSAQVCAPSRCSLMLGLHSGHCTIRGNDGSYCPLLDTDITVAKALRRAGWATALFGKWGLGNFGSSGYPLSQGFDTFVGQDSQGSCHDWYPLTLQKDLNKSFHLNTKEQVWNGSVCLGPPLPDQCTWTNDFDKANAVAYIRARAHISTPYFMYLSSTTPHIGHLGSRCAIVGQYTDRAFCFVLLSFSVEGL
jgi:arylsulfatase A